MGKWPRKRRWHILLPQLLAYKEQIGKRDSMAGRSRWQLQDLAFEPMEKVSQLLWYGSIAPKTNLELISDYDIQSNNGNHRRTKELWLLDVEIILFR